MSLAVKYRPKEFCDVVGQSSTVKILTKQIEVNSIYNCYLFSGASGCGKTTVARIFANKINKGCGQPIEIDAASNNGVDNIRQISETAQERSLDSVYKVYIIDECHMLSNNAWNAMLKLIEETPKYTIFIFCTTDPQKIPATIVNRCQVFNFTKMTDEQIFNRLKYVCDLERYEYDIEGLDLISKCANGSMRQSLTLLDKCKDYSIVINAENVSNCLGDYSYDTMFNLVNSIIKNDSQSILYITDKLSNEGLDLKQFINNFLKFTLQLNRVLIFKKFTNATTLPISCKNSVNATLSLIDIENRETKISKIVDTILEIKQAIKGDVDIKTTIDIMLLNLGKEVSK